MVTMKMADKDPRNTRGSNICKDKLALSPLSRIKEEPFFVPAEEIGPMITTPSGLLRRAT
jgi:hypothetical protein